MSAPACRCRRTSSCTNPARAAFAPAEASASEIWSTRACGSKSDTTTSSCLRSAAATSGGRPGRSTTGLAVTVFGVAFCFTRATAGRRGAFARSGACAPGFRMGWRGLVVARLAWGAPAEGRPMVNMKTASPSAATPPRAATTRIWELIVSVTWVLSASRGWNERGRGRPRPLEPNPGAIGLADARGDRPVGAALEVGDRGRIRVLDAVARVVGTNDLHVLDALVVGLLELRERHARVAGGVVGVEGLHAGDGGADVGLRGRVVGPIPEAQVGGDRDCEQDPEDDDDDEQLDQGEAALVTREAFPQGADHWRACSFRTGKRWLERYRRRPSESVRPERVSRGTRECWGGPTPFANTSVARDERE